MRITRYLCVAAAFAALAGCGQNYELDQNCQNYMMQEYGSRNNPQCWHPA